MQDFINGVSGVYLRQKKIISGLSQYKTRGLQMIGISDMSNVLATCSQMSVNTVKPHQWVRIRSGLYKDDLGLVEMIETNGSRALVRLLPRIPAAWY